MTTADGRALAHPRTTARGWRASVRRTPAGALALKLAVLVIGTSLILLGLALVVLPGPLTIPPMLLGFWVLSTEFAWADRLLERTRASGVVALAAARRRPVLSSVTTGAGLVLAGVAIWAANTYDLVGRALEVLGW